MAIKTVCDKCGNDCGDKRYILELLKPNIGKPCLGAPIELSQLRYDLCENCKKKLEIWLEE